MTGPVSLDIQIEELVETFPEAVRFLTRRGVRCIRCGEPVWGILGELLLPRLLRLWQGAIRAGVLPEHTAPRQSWNGDTATLGRYRNEGHIPARESAH